MATLRIRIELNKGKAGIPMDKLAKLTEETQKFLDMVGEDVDIEIDKGKWLATDFEEGSLFFTAKYVGAPDELKVEKYNDALEFAFTLDPEQIDPDGPLRMATLLQYSKIGSPIDADEVVGFGLYRNERDVSSWHYLKKDISQKIFASIETPIEYYGTVQGIIHSWYKESIPPHFHVRELSSKQLIKCQYSDEKYDEVVKLFKKKVAIVFVSGQFRVKRAERKIEHLNVARLEEAPELSKEDFKRFFGIAPDLTGDLTTEEYIDRIRGDGD